MTFDGLSSAFSLVYSGIHYAFEMQAAFWDEFGVFPTFILVFVAAVFFRYIVLRMFGAAEAGVSDSVVSSAKRDAYAYRQRVSAKQRIANYQARRKK